MKCIEILINGEHVCTAGIGEFQVLSATLSHIGRSPQNMDMLESKNGPDPSMVADKVVFHVSGLEMDADVHQHWIEEDGLGVGDEVTVRIVASDTPDPPVRTSTMFANEAERRERIEAYVREQAADLGWQIIEDPA